MELAACGRLLLSSGLFAIYGMRGSCACAIGLLRVCIATKNSARGEAIVPVATAPILRAVWPIAPAVPRLKVVLASLSQWPQGHQCAVTLPAVRGHSSLRSAPGRQARSVAPGYSPGNTSRCPGLPGRPPGGSRAGQISAIVHYRLPGRRLWHWAGPGCPGPLGSSRACDAMWAGIRCAR